MEVGASRIHKTGGTAGVYGTAQDRNVFSHAPMSFPLSLLIQLPQWIHKSNQDT